MKQTILKLIILPTIILYGLIPRCVHHFPKAGAVLLFIFLVFQALVYFYIRYMLVNRSLREKNVALLDTLCAIFGVIVACFFSYELFLPLLFSPAALPLFLNNHKVMLFDKVKKMRAAKNAKKEKAESEMIDEIDFALFE
ncbi:MAG: hypothetical protein IJL87_03410 [Clostridia bacterium]|nr:hypothetical protein [Clostridia bacterium]